MLSTNVKIQKIRGKKLLQAKYLSPLHPEIPEAPAQKYVFIAKRSVYKYVRVLVQKWVIGMRLKGMFMSIQPLAL